ncbi:hypothetical protein POV27_05945 [Aureisphaera galaxeae]|uniref:hypothetical protein n=1 Tax=Aureisphaera galaxeae TaxID=1538023 RepID=UPI002350B783|nr:hypothetical protein [Aureisphaera galaxeae]MDC8003584.1 hypothetical protein [Aureisphaera galaxeae]
MDTLKTMGLHILLFLVVGTFTCIAQEHYGFYDHNLVFESSHWAQKRKIALEQRMDSAESKLRKLLLDLERNVPGCNTPKETDKRIKQVYALQNKIETFRKRALQEIDSIRTIDSIYVNNKIYIALENFKEETNINHLYPEKVVLYCESCTDFSNELIQYIKSTQ